MKEMEALDCRDVSGVVAECRTVNLALNGVGSVGTHLLEIVAAKAETFRRSYAIRFRFVLVADSTGCASMNPSDPGSEAGFDALELLRLKRGGGKISSLPQFCAGVAFVDAMAALPCHLLLEASPVDLKTGGVALEICRASLQRGTHVVLANKGPLVVAFHELHRLARTHSCSLLFSATVCGGLPVVNMGRHDMVAAEVTQVRGVFNSTTNFILSEIAAGSSYDAALAEAQRRGVAETDPSLDVDGWDTANKLLIIANSMLGIECVLADINVDGIRQVTADMVLDAKRSGCVYKLVASAVLTTPESPSGARPQYSLSVRPTVLQASDFLASCDGWEMGVEITSDIYGIMYHKLYEREPTPTAASMLRDAVNIFSAAAAAAVPRGCPLSQ